VTSKDKQPYLLDYAKIDWQQDNPYSLQHKDIYWSRGNPIQEKRHVFAERHQLDERGKGVSQFTILETGFGFGNNFLITAEAWRDLGHQGILNYVAIENSPVNPDDLKRHFQTLNLRYADWLIEH
jgi:tRNA 5-methylaminomethyl-2-thiouridine biosynthesis bifunctional protein